MFPDIFSPQSLAGIMQQVQMKQETQKQQQAAQQAVQPVQGLWGPRPMNINPIPNRPVTPAPSGIAPHGAYDVDWSKPAYRDDQGNSVYEGGTRLGQTLDGLY